MKFGRKFRRKKNQKEKKRRQYLFLNLWGWEFHFYQQPLECWKTLKNIVFLSNSRIKKVRKMFYHYPEFSRHLSQLLLQTITSLITLVSEFETSECYKYMYRLTDKQYLDYCKTNWLIESGFKAAYFRQPLGSPNAAYIVIERIGFYGCVLSTTSLVPKCHLYCNWMKQV